MSDENIKNKKKLFLVELGFTEIHEFLCYANNEEEVRDKKFPFLDFDEIDIYPTDEFKILDAVEVNEEDYYPPEPTEEELEKERIEREKRRIEREAAEESYKELLPKFKELHEKLGKTKDNLCDDLGYEKEEDYEDEDDW